MTSLLVSEDQISRAIEVDELLAAWGTSRPHLAQMVEIRFFAGLSEAEIALAQGVSERTVKRY